MSTTAELQPPQSVKRPLWINPTRRREALDAEVAARAAEGFTLTDGHGPHARMERAAQTNRRLHLLLSFGTLGLWLPVWVLVALTHKPTTIALSVDVTGHVTTRYTA